MSTSTRPFSQLKVLANMLKKEYGVYTHYKSVKHTWPSMNNGNNHNKTRRLIMVLKRKKKAKQKCNDTSFQNTANLWKLIFLRSKHHVSIMYLEKV